MVPPPSSTSPTESTSSGISSQKSNMGLDELIESLSYFVETSNTSSPTTTTHGVANEGSSTMEMSHQNKRRDMANGRIGSSSQTMVTPMSLRSKRELMASMNGTIRRGPADLELTPITTAGGIHSSSIGSNHSERHGGLSWRNQVNKEMERKCSGSRRSSILWRREREKEPEDHP